MRTTISDHWTFDGSLEDAYADCKRRLELHRFLDWRQADVSIDPLVKTNDGQTVIWDVRIRCEVVR
jgi:virulence-associated protein VapD